MEQTAGETIARQAVQALKDDNFVSNPGYCQRYARQVAEAVGGTIEAVADEFRRNNARETMEAYQETKYDIWSRVGLPGRFPPVTLINPGDFAYKGFATSGFFGHVAIFVPGHMLGFPDVSYLLCENSSYHENPAHTGNVSGAKGFRTMEQFGAIEMLVRITI